jgi:hypothetical protein
MELGRDDFRVVENEGIAGTKQIGKIAHMPVLERSLRPHHQEARRVARPRRSERDPVFGQIEIEEIDAHSNP